MAITIRDVRTIATAPDGINPVSYTHLVPPEHGRHLLLGDVRQADGGHLRADPSAHGGRSVPGLSLIHIFQAASAWILIFAS